MIVALQASRRSSHRWIGTRSSAQLYQSAVLPLGAAGGAATGSYGAGAGALMLPRAQPSPTELAGFLPRSAPRQERPRRRLQTAKVLLAYFVAHAVPISAGVWYFQRQKEEKLRNAIACLPPGDASAITKEATRVMRSCAEPFLLTVSVVRQKSGSIVGGGGGAGAVSMQTQRVECLHPEERPVRTRTAADLEGVSRDSELGNLVAFGAALASTVAEAADSGSASGSSPESAAERSYPLRHVHFAVQRDSDAYRCIVDAGSRRQTLFYPSSHRQAYCTVQGTVSVVEDPEVRQWYWNSRFRSCIKKEAGESGVGKSDGEESTEQVTARSGCSAGTEPWRDPDFVLLRMHPDVVELKSCHAAEQWERRTVSFDASTKRWCVNPSDIIGLA